MGWRARIGVNLLLAVLGAFLGFLFSLTQGSHGTRWPWVVGGAIAFVGFGLIASEMVSNRRRAPVAEPEKSRKPNVIGKWTKLAAPGQAATRLGVIARNESADVAVDVELVAFLRDFSQLRTSRPRLEHGQEIHIDVGPRPSGAQAWSDPLSHITVRFSNADGSERWERRWDWHLGAGDAHLTYDDPV